MDRSELLHNRAGGVCSQGGREDLGDALGQCIATLGRYRRDGLRLYLGRRLIPGEIDGQLRVGR